MRSDVRKSAASVFKAIDKKLKLPGGGCSDSIAYMEQSSWLLFLRYLDDREAERKNEAMVLGRPYTPALPKELAWSTWADLVKFEKLAKGGRGMRGGVRRDLPGAWQVAEGGRKMTGMGSESASALARTGDRPDEPTAVGVSPLAAKFLRPVVHRMGRRCFRWDYKGRGVYLITIVAAKRGRGVWGRVVAEDEGAEDEGASAHALTGGRPEISPLAAKFKPNEIGQIIEREWLRLAEAWPGVRLLAHQVMEDHFHGVIATPSFMKKPLGAIIGSLKARVSSAVGASIWAEGYVDTILFDDEAVEKAVRYVRENPWRLLVKREHPELFKVLRDLEIKGVGHFAAIGNHFLLDTPNVVQLQCSRSDFAYERDAKGAILRDRPPRVKTAAFDEKLADMTLEIAHGAAVVSPCISEGERELARLAFDAGAKVITLQNKGFSPLYKPGGHYFEACANGRLLMLAPAAWPYLPGQKPITRATACTLNRIAQLIAGPGAAAINYRGMQVADVDRLVAEAVKGAVQ